MNTHSRDPRTLESLFYIICRLYCDIITPFNVFFLVKFQQLFNIQLSLEVNSCNFGLWWQRHSFSFAGAVLTCWNCAECILWPNSSMMFRLSVLLSMTAGVPLLLCGHCCWLFLFWMWEWSRVRGQLLSLKLSWRKLTTVFYIRQMSITSPVHITKKCIDSNNEALVSVYSQIYSIIVKCGPV